MDDIVGTSPITVNGIQPAKLFGKTPPCHLNYGIDVSAAASTTRAQYDCQRGSSRKAEADEKNEHPHSTERTRSSTQDGGRSSVAAGAWES